MKLILVRHGETDHNVKQLLQGQTDIPLNEKGRQQAFAAGQALAQFEIDFVYCSDLIRTRQTAEEILKSVNMHISYASWLRERNFGVFEGHPREHFQQHIENHDLDFFTFTPENGESMFDVLTRAQRGFSELVANHPDGAVLLITHGGLMANLVLHLLKADKTEYVKYRAENCEIFILDVTKNSATLLERIKK